MKFFSRKIPPIWIVALWVLFSVALATWWVFFVYHFFTQLLANQTIGSFDLLAKQKMLIWEGITIAVSFLGGGIALAYYIFQENKRNSQIKEFFTAFSHDLKTPIASLRLQAESLEEDLSGSVHVNVIRRLLKDTVRLEIQLENSIYFSQIEELGRLHLELTSMEAIVAKIRSSWPELAMHLEKNCVVKADIRALETILKNLASNAFVHGKSTELFFRAKQIKNNRVQISIEDNGKGFNLSNQKKKNFNGMGLYLVESLTRKMYGQARFENIAQNGLGFRAVLEFEGKVI